MPWLPSARLFTLSAVALAILTVCNPACADDYFNLSALETDSPLENTGALEAYLRNNGLTPGRYLTSIMWGREKLDKRNLNYVLSADKQKLLPQLTKADLRDLGVKVDAITAFTRLKDSDVVGNISDFIPGATYIFHADTQVLNLNIPQIYRNAAAVGEINPKYWDDGVPVLWTSYYVSGSQQKYNATTSNSTWLNLNSGMNLGAWRLRNSGTWGDGEGWQSLNTTLQRDVKSLKSQFTGGQTYTNGDLFDSVQMTGIKLETDTNMLPSSQQGFAPVVRGIANSDAKVTAKQNGYTIYQSYVSAGPFEIRDLSQVTAGTDLQVTVKEADGSEHSFIQASSSVPVLQREGALKYSVAAGQYRDANGGEFEPGFGQLSAMYGLPYGVTAYGGLLGASMYRSGLVGVGADLQDFGSASMDITVATTAFDDGRDDSQGVSWRAQYAKDFSLTETTLTLASYRYSTSGFYTFQEAVDQRNYAKNDENSDDIYSYRNTNNRRSRLQMNLSQPIGSWGSVYANAYQQDYWDLSGHERSVSFGYNNSWLGTNWSLSYSLTKTPYSDNDQQLALTVNVPLSRWLSNAWATYSLNSSENGNTSHQVGISGTTLADNNLTYNLQQSYTDNNVGYGAYMSGRYRGSAGEVSSSYSYTKDTRQWSYSAQGSVVAHSHGVTLGRSLQDAFAVVHIDDGADVKVQSAQGIRTDLWGNAIVPTLTSYRHNTVTVNSQGRDDLDIQDASLDLVPTKGAAVLAAFNARAGKRGLLTLRHHGGAVPFGAVLSVDNTTSIVGDDGEVYVTGLKEATRFTVQWGEGSAQHCSGAVTVPEQISAPVFKASVACR